MQETTDIVNATCIQTDTKKKKAVKKKKKKNPIKTLNSNLLDGLTLQ